jgi:uncharacterized protein (DUF924 family)
VTPRDIVDFWMAAGPARWFTKDAALTALAVPSAPPWQARLRAFDHGATDGRPWLHLLLDQASRTSIAAVRWPRRRCQQLLPGLIGRNYHHPRRAFLC